MWQIHTDTNFERAQKVLSVLPPLLTQSHILSDVFSVVPPQFKSHGRPKEKAGSGNIWGKTHQRERERVGEKEEGGHQKQLERNMGQRKHDPWVSGLWKSIESVTFWIPPCLGGRRVGGARGIPKQPLRGPVLWERKRGSESAGRGPKTMTSSLCAITSGEHGHFTHTHTHTVKPKTVFTPTQGHDRVDEFQLKHLTLYERAEYGCLFLSQSKK